ncbi:MAG: ATP-binding cassette domain-containing protein [Acidimicrobiia bacterium]|nr:ATP-binding cassette domain-containing protein [Acidimicrobiia bacterium]
MARPPGVIVQFDRVTVTRDTGVYALRDFSLSIHAGEVMAVVGRSGAGKTTAMKLVNRLIDPSAGTVMVEGRSTREWDPIALRRRTGYVFQEVGLFPHMTVEENAGIVGRLERWPVERAQRRVRELLDLVGLSPDQYARRLPHELSGGQRQRVGVARALFGEPPVLLMDEPFGALDPITRAELRREFARIQRLVGTTVIMVTHDLGEAFELGTRVGVIDDGCLVACAPPHVIASLPDPRIRALLDAWPARPQTASAG